MTKMCFFIVARSLAALARSNAPSWLAQIGIDAFININWQANGAFKGHDFYFLLDWEAMQEHISHELHLSAYEIYKWVKHVDLNLKKK